jgi:hypothetical protein
MQTIQFIETVKWIQTVLEPAKILLSGELEAIFYRGREEKEYSEKIPSVFLDCSHHLARIQPQLNSHKFAPTVLRAFGLEDLLDSAFPVRIARILLFRDEKHSTPGGRESINKTSRFWRILSGCVEPIEKITTPVSVITEKDFDEILTVEVRYPEKVEPAIDTLTSVLRNVEGIYTAPR